MSNMNTPQIITMIEGCSLVQMEKALKLLGEILTKMQPSESDHTQYELPSNSTIKCDEQVYSDTCTFHVAMQMSFDRIKSQ